MLAVVSTPRLLWNVDGRKVAGVRVQVPYFTDHVCITTDALYRAAAQPDLGGFVGHTQATLQAVADACRALETNPPEQVS